MIPSAIIVQPQTLNHLSNHRHTILTRWALLTLLWFPIQLCEGWPPSQR